MDSGQRSFCALAAVGLAAYLVIGLSSCLILALAGDRVSADGMSAFGRDPGLFVAGALFLAVVTAGAAGAVVSLAIQGASSRRLSRRVGAARLPSPPVLAAAARRAGLEGRVVLFSAPEPLSFAYGSLTPRVAVSSGLLDRLSKPELDAVLTHERHHVRSLDPLKLMLARTLGAGLFYLPIGRELVRRYRAGSELAADRHAAASCGRRPLAAALLKLVGRPPWWELETAAGIAGHELMPVRVEQLELGHEPVPGGIPRAAVLVSGMGAFALLAAVVAAVASAGGLAALSHSMLGIRMAPGAVWSMAACSLPAPSLACALYLWLRRRAPRAS